MPRPTLDLPRRFVQGHHEGEEMGILDALISGTHLCDKDFWKYASKEDVRIELDRGANINALDDVDSTPLHYAAAYSNDLSIISLLLKCGANIEAQNLSQATPLHFAASYNSVVSVTKVLVELGANIGARTEHGFTPLHLAVGGEKNAHLIVGFLLYRGVDIETLDNESRTPLHHAAAHNRNSSVMDCLLERKANLEAQDAENWTPLHQAVGYNSDPSAVEFLLNKGASIEAKTKIGWTPLHNAAANSEEPSVVTLLLDRGANPKAYDDGRKTPFDLVKENGALKNTEAHRRLEESQRG